MRYVAVAVVTVLIGAYAVVALVTREHWMGPGSRSGTAITFGAKAPDGSAPTADQMAEAQRVLERRTSRLDAPGATVTVDGDRLVATVPGDGGLARDLSAPGAQLFVRPVVHAIAAQTPTKPSPAPTAPTAEAAQRISDEKALRQSKDQQIQLLALQFQATRCGEPDPLTGRDDPDLPLITCSRDGTQVYLLDAARFHGLDIASATTRQDGGRNVVTLEFTPSAAESLARYTGENRGRQLAFAVDTSVVSAPEIREPIPNGHVDVAGNFTADQAHDLATALDDAKLPVTLQVESTSPATLTGVAPSLPLRIALIGTGLLLVMAAIAVGAWIALSRRSTGP